MAEATKAAMSGTTKQARRVIFADFATVKYQGVIELLERGGITCETSTETDKLLLRIAEEKFDLLVINLLLGGIGPFELIQNLKKSSANPEIRIIVVTRQVHKMNIQNTIRAGANDFIAEPFEAKNLNARIVYHLGPVKEIATSGFDKIATTDESKQFIRVLLEATELLSRTAREKTHDSIYVILQQLAKSIDSNRSSLIIVDEASNTGVVLASSDDPNFKNYPIRLDQYPEILHVIHTGNLIFVENVAENTLTEQIKSNVRTISIGSLMVFPVCYQGDVVGVLNVRREKTTELPSMEQMRILQAIANIMAAHSNVAVLLRRIYKDFAGSSAA